MKRLILVLKLFLFTSVFGYTQDYIEVSPDAWSFMTDTSYFDGKVSRAAFIIGTTNDYRMKTPLLAVNKTDGKPTQIHLAYFPADICGNMVALIRFDEPIIYQLKVNYTYQPPRYTIVFNESISINQFITKLQSNKTVHIRLMNSVMQLDAKFALNESTAAIMKLDQ